MMKRILFFDFLTTLFSSCDTGELASTPSELEGVWVFKAYQRAENMHEWQDCTDGTKEVTLVLIRKGKGFEVSGQSVINMYSSSAEVSYSSGTRSGTIKFGSVGGTKMGGPENLMNCERIYYQYLENVSGIKIEGNRLYLERVPLPVESQIWPVMVFEKKKV